MTISEEDWADLTSHKIQDYVGGLRIPLFTQLDDTLWVGGCPVSALPKHFKYVVDVYTNEYYLNTHAARLACTLWDSHVLPDTSVIVTLAKTVNLFRKAGPTLVHCQAGLNRSNLIVAQALILEGMDPVSAIEFLRTKRSREVLCNTVFEKYLRSQRGVV